MAKYWVGGTGNTNDPTNHWATTSGGAPGAGNTPTAADDLIFDGNSGVGTVTINAALAGRSIQTAGSSITSCTHNAGITATYGDATAGAGNKAIDLSGFSTYTLGNATTSAISLVSTSATQQTITTNGKTTGNFTINGAASSYLLADALTATGNLTLTAGTLDTGSFSVTCLTFISTGSATRQLDAGTSTFNLTSTATVTIWNAASTGSTFNVSNTTIIITNTSANTRSFGGNAATRYGTLTYTVAGSTGQLNIVTAGYIDTLNFSDVTNARTLAFTATAVFTIDHLNTNGTSGKLMSVVSITGGTPAYLYLINAPDSVDYVSFQDIYSIIPGKLYATNSTDVSGNTNITFSALLPGPYIAFFGDNSGTGANISVVLPYATIAGDFLVAGYGTTGAGTGVVTPASGFVQDVGTSATTSLRIFSKVADGTETTLAWSITTSPAATSLQIQVWRGWTGTPTFDVSDGNTGSAITSLATNGSNPSNTGNPAAAVAIFQGSGSMGASSVGTPPTNGFGLIRDTAEISTGRMLAKLLSSNAAVSTTFTWTTSRNAVAHLAVYKDVFSNAHLLASTGAGN